MRLLLAVIAFTLASPALAQKPTTPTKDDGDKVICKRQVETGSLVRASKTCKTKREWKDQVANAQDTITRNVGSGSIDLN